MDNLVYTVAEAAKVLKSNKHYVYSLIRAGLLPAMKLGTLKISHEALTAFIQENQGKDLTDPFNVREMRGA
jgi:excisionase family DNA binding protein